MSLKTWLVGLIAPDMQAELSTARAKLSSISARVDDSRGWENLNQHPGDRSYAERYLDLQDATEAWRKNFFVRRLVTLTRAYVIGGGIVFSSNDADVQSFLTKFWTHRKNKIEQRLGPICDQLVKDGELFPILYTNATTGISYIRFRTSQQITGIETLKNDWEAEIAYTQNTNDPAKPKRWYSPQHASAQRKLSKGRLHPVMLHWTVNKPIDGLRGESDLTPVLPWARRYQEWLSDRVRLNRQRTRQGMMDVEVADDSQVEARRRQLEQHNPVAAGIYVHGKGETATFPNLTINANDASGDGLALRLAIATGSNTALHYLGEGGNVNYAVAKEMGEPTSRFYGERQKSLIWMLEDLIETAYERFHLHQTGLLLPDNYDLQLTANVTEVARADNLTLAQAANEIAQAFATAAAHAWTDDETALKMIMKFAGEALSEPEILKILANAKAEYALDVQRAIDEIDEQVEIPL